ncbi:MAG: hypothetical protein Q9212_003124 [Teloschistes hypoglaucus]
MSFVQLCLKFWGAHFLPSYRENNWKAPNLLDRANKPRALAEAPHAPPPGL